MKTPTIKTTRRCVAAIALALPCISVQAATSYNGPDGGAWDDEPNWSNGLPNASDWTEVKHGGSVVISGDVAPVQQIFLGGNSTISHTAGTLATSDGFAVTIGDGGVGTYNITGGTFNPGNPWFIVGGNGPGTGFLNVSGTGVVNVTGSGIVLGQDSNASTGHLTIGSGGLVTGNQVTTFGGEGSGGTGIINLNAGGTLSLNDGINSNNGSVTVNFDGGTLRVNNSGDKGNFVQSNVAVTLLAGGATFDTNDQDTGIQAAMSGVGGFTVLGGNQLKSGANHTFQGDVGIQAGTFTIENAGSMTFYIGEDGVNNQIFGDGHFNAFGSFNFDLADAAAIGSWTIVDTGSSFFGDDFVVNGWTNNLDDTWTFGNYTFSEASGILTAVPEPATGVLIGGGLLALAFGRRRGPARR